MTAAALSAAFLREAEPAAYLAAAAALAVAGGWAATLLVLTAMLLGPAVAMSD